MIKVHILTFQIQQRDDPLHLHHMTQLTTPETSTIMLRRNSALAHSKDGSSTPKSLNSSFDAKHSPGVVGKKQRFVRYLMNLLFSNYFFPHSSPRFPIPPGETPKLPPKPKQSGKNITPTFHHANFHNLLPPFRSLDHVSLSQLNNATNLAVLIPQNTQI